MQRREGLDDQAGGAGAGRDRTGAPGVGRISDPAQRPPAATTGLGSQGGTRGPAGVGAATGTGTGGPAASATSSGRGPGAGGAGPAPEPPGVVDQVQQKAGEVAEQVQEKAGDLVDKAKQQVSSRLSGQIEGASQSLSSVSQAVLAVGRQLREQDQAPLANFADQAAEQVLRLSGYLRGKDLDELVDDTEQLARRSPALFLGSAFTLGMLAARFLKSSGQQQRQRRAIEARRPAAVGPMAPDGTHPDTNIFDASVAQRSPMRQAPAPVPPAYRPPSLQPVPPNPAPPAPRTPPPGRSV